MEYAMRVMIQMCLENKKAVRFTSGQLCLVWRSITDSQSHVPFITGSERREAVERLPVHSQALNQIFLKIITAFHSQIPPDKLGFLMSGRRIVGRPLVLNRFA